MIQAKNIWKIFSQAGPPLKVLQGVSLHLKPGKRIAVVGASGAGKSTLLHILGGLEPPNEGEVSVQGENFYSLPDKMQARLRGKLFGFVFQFYHLLPELSVLENVSLPGLIQGLPPRQCFDLAAQALSRVGLEEKKSQYPAPLSGGEQQRVAIARACLLGPPVILADEPTGNLDHKTGEQVFDYLLESLKGDGSLVMATHNLELAKKLDEVYELEDGLLHPQ